MQKNKIKAEIKYLEVCRDKYKKKIKRGSPVNKYEIKISGKNNKEKSRILKNILEALDNEGYVINYKPKQKDKLIIGDIGIYLSKELSDKRKLLKKVRSKKDKQTINESIEILKKALKGSDFL